VSRGVGKNFFGGDPEREKSKIEAFVVFGELRRLF